MKEITYNEWDNNPREMWVWDNDISNKVKRKVVYITEKYKTSFPVVALNETQASPCLFMHCAEIEEPRRMTNQELSWWLREGKHREYINRTGGYVHFEYVYLPCDADEYVSKGILIRENNGEWREPLMETEE